MKKYYVDYGTGAGNYDSTLELEGLKREVEDHAAYTQQTIHIMLADEIVATLPWYGVEPDDDAEAIVTFGVYGYYGKWY